MSSYPSSCLDKYKHLLLEFYPWVYQESRYNHTLGAECESEYDCVPVDFPYDAPRQRRFACARRYVPIFITEASASCVATEVLPDHKVCTCDIAYGAAGPDCLEYSNIGYFFVLVLILAVTFQFGSVLYHMQGLYQLIREPPPFSGRSYRKIANMLFVVLTSAGFGIWDAMFVLYTTSREYSESIDLGHTSFTIGLSFGATCFTVSSLMVSLHLIKSVPMTRKSSFSSLMRKISMGNKFLRIVFVSYLPALLIAQGVFENVLVIGSVIIVYLILNLSMQIIGPALVHYNVRAFAGSQPTDTSKSTSKKRTTMGTSTINSRGKRHFQEQLKQVVRDITRVCIKLSISQAIGIVMAILSVFSGTRRTLVMAQVLSRASLGCTLLVIHASLVTRKDENHLKRTVYPNEESDEYSEVGTLTS